MLSHYSKGNPLHQNTNLVNDLKKNFRENTETCCWEYKPNFNILSNEYRNVKVFKVSSLIQFLQAFTNVLLTEKEILSNQNFVNLNFLKDKLKNSVWIEVIAYFLNSNIDDTIDAIICSIPDNWLIKLHNIFSYGTVLSYIYSIFNPLYGIPCGIIFNCLCSISTKKVFKKERITNISNVLNSIISSATNYREQISNSNVFIMAIDERNFNCYLIHNSFRRNDSGWCNFVLIDDLNDAPKAKECNDWKQINEYLDIIQLITSKKPFNFQDIRNRIDSLIK